MKRLGILGFALWLGLLAPALAVLSQTFVGNVNYTILPTDVTVSTQVAFTAARTWTLPPAGQTCIGQTCASDVLSINDNIGAISLLNPLIIAPVSGETINGSSSSITITAPYTSIALQPVSGSNWLLSINGATQTTITGTAPTVFHAGGVGAPAAATGTDSTAVNTETYIVEVFVPVQTTLTGVSWLGLSTSTGNVQFSLANSAGTIITAAQTASTATAGTAVYQAAAFVTPYVAAPGKYFILMQNSGSNHYRSQVVGTFGASKKTGETYGTFTNVTPPTTFTTNLAPFVDTY